MPVEKSSMLCLKNGKYIKANDNYGYPFMLCFGKDRHNQTKLYLIECITNDYKVYLCQNENEADDTAFNIIIYVARNGKITDFLDKIV